MSTGDGATKADTPSSLKSNALLMGSGVGLSRISGLVREQVFAWLFGAGIAAEAFIAAMRIPNFFRDLLAENISSSAVVPVYTSTKAKEGTKEAARFAGGALSMFLVGSSIIAAIGILLAPVLVSLFTPGFSSDSSRFLLTVRLTKMLFPFLIFISVAALFQAIQNAEGRFFVPAVSSGCLNVVFVTTGWMLSRIIDPPIVGMAIGALIGAASAVIFLMPGYLKSTGGRLAFFAFWTMGSIRSLALMAGPLILGVAAVQVNVLVNTIVASLAEPGAMAYLNYAYRVMHLPLGLIAVTLSSAALPALARCFHSDDVAAYKTTLNTAMDYALRLAIPAGIGLIILRNDIVGVLFNYGAFDAADVSSTAKALAAYALGVPAYSMNRVFSAGYYAKQDAKTPVKIGSIGVITNIVLNILAILIGAGYVGIAAAAAIAGWTQSCLYAINMKRAGGVRAFDRVAAQTSRIAFGILLMCAGIVAVQNAGIENRILRTSIEIVVGGGSYFLVALRGLIGKRG